MLHVGGEDTAHGREPWLVYPPASHKNLNMNAEINNEHHEIEAISEAYAGPFAWQQSANPLSNYLASMKGVL